MAGSLGTLRQMSSYTQWPRSGRTRALPRPPWHYSKPTFAQISHFVPLSGLGAALGCRCVV